MHGAALLFYANVKNKRLWKTRQIEGPIQRFAVVESWPTVLVLYHATAL